MNLPRPQGSAEGSGLSAGEPGTSGASTVGSNSMGRDYMEAGVHCSIYIIIIIGLVLT